MMAQHWMLAWKLCDFQGIRTIIATKPCISASPPSASAHGDVSQSLSFGKSTENCCKKKKIDSQEYILIFA